MKAIMGKTVEIPDELFENNAEGIMINGFDIHGNRATYCADAIDLEPDGVLIYVPAIATKNLTKERP